MASIRRETVIEASPQNVWEALRDVGALHTRLAPGFVKDVTLEPGVRSGMVLRERIVSVDDATRRVVWSATGGTLSHHNGSAQVFDEGEARSRFVWIADVLPDAAAAPIAGLMEQGLAVIKRHLEQTERALGSGNAS